ncbi:MAG: TrbG/VirB9 family P-type conjugative transfer protein [Pseudomonadota bacterium]|nr:TrbG/VirB9 family P-type conjugative transfer protein [Pseudomonadota bacterium]
MKTRIWYCLLFLAAPAWADKPIQEAPPRTAPEAAAFADTRLAVYAWHPDQVFPVLARAGMYTVLAFEPGERVQGLYLSDTARWQSHVAGDKRHVLIRPFAETAAGSFNSGTVITDRRVYQLVLESRGEKERWHQRVSWYIPGAAFDELEAAVGRNPRKGEAESVSAEAQRLRSSEAPSAMPGVAPGVAAEVATEVATEAAEASPVSVDLARSSFDYKIEGEAEFRPAAVFDDGRFTWFRMPKGAQVSPALFAVDAKGEAEIVAYVPVEGDWFKATRVAPGWLLRLGSEEVRIEARGGKASFPSRAKSATDWPWGD